MRRDNNVSSRMVWLILGVFVVSSFVAYTPSYIHSFVSDDYKHLGFVQSVFDKPFTVFRVFNPYYSGWYYRPTQHVYFALFRFLFGTNSIPYYVGLLFLHTSNIILVYVVVRIWGETRIGALCTAGAFSVIHTHQEVVGWISAVSILLAATFTLLSFYFLRMHLDNPLRIKYLVITGVMIILSIFSREECIVLFPVLLLFCFLFHRFTLNKSEILLFTVLGLFVVSYCIIIFLRPTWTPHTDALLVRNLTDFTSIRNLSQFFFQIFNSYLAIRNTLDDFRWEFLGLLVTVVMLIAYIFIRGKAFLRLSIIWTFTLYLFLYVIVWLFTGQIAHRYLYLPWLGICLIVGDCIDCFSNKYFNKYFAPVMLLFIVANIFFHQIPLSLRSQRQWQEDAAVAASNAAQIKSLVPDISEYTHFFAYDMPPITDYIQSMAAVWFDVKLDGRGGHWKRLLGSGYATSHDYFLNYENGLVYNAMPELQQYEKTYFVWQTDPIAEIIHFDGTSETLDPTTYNLDRIVGPPGQKRFGFSMCQPMTDYGWASLTYNTIVTDGSFLMFGIRRDWEHANKDGMIFRINIVDSTNDQQILFYKLMDSLGENWTELALDMKKYWGQTVSLQFQVRAIENPSLECGYWANPRLIVNDVN